MFDGAVRPRTVVKSSKWPEPVILDLIEKVGEYYRVVGSTINSRQHIDQLLSESEYSSLSLALLPADFSANPRLVFLGLETKR